MTSQPESHAAAVDVEVIDLSVPADPAYLSVMRCATAGLGSHLNLTVDEIEDLQIAVDEACALLIGTGRAPVSPDAELFTCFTAKPGSLTIRIDGPAQVLPNGDSFAWTMLHALSGDVRTGQNSAGSWIQLTCLGRGAAG